MPYMPAKREYRAIEVTNFKPVESDGDSYVVEGYATTFDDPYALYGDYKETIDRHALDDADMTDVIFQFDHAGTPMARIRNNTLSIFADDHGLLVHADLGGCQRGRELHEAISNGLVDRMSWGFTVAEDGWEYDRATHTSTITRVDKIYDVSAVSFPANEGTEIKARSYLDGVIEAERQELSQCQAGERERLALALQTL